MDRRTLLAYVFAGALAMFAVAVAEPRPCLHRTAAYGSHAELRSCLEATPEVDARDALGRTALMQAAAHAADPAALRLLVDAGADVHAAGDGGATALTFAARRTDPGFVRTLVDAGAEVDSATDDGRTPLMFAVLKPGTEATVWALLELGADPNAADATGTPPLIWAAEYGGDPGAIDALVRAGADPNATDRQGRTALVAAVAAGGDPARVRALLRGGADDVRSPLERRILDRLQASDVVPDAEPCPAATVARFEPAAVVCFTFTVPDDANARSTIDAVVLGTEDGASDGASIRSAGPWRMLGATARGRDYRDGADWATVAYDGRRLYVIPDPGPNR